MARKITGLRQLGAKTPLPKSPDEAELERVPNPHQDTAYIARFTAPEFTCLCPVTGQPDFAHFVIDYAPRKWLVESKSLKLYLASFRNVGAFHEDATITIGNGRVTPSEVSISVGQSVTFVNNDGQTRNVTSDPHPIHTDCPQINAVGNIANNQTKLTDAFPAARSCGFHNHDDPDNANFKGRINIQ